MTRRRGAAANGAFLQSLLAACPISSLSVKVQTDVLTICAVIPTHLISSADMASRSDVL